MEKHYSLLQKDLLVQAVDKLDEKKPLLIYGAFGAGKKTFIDKLISEYSRINPQTDWVRIDFNNFPVAAFDSQNSLWINIITAFAVETGQELSDDLKGQIEFGIIPQTIMTNLFEITLKNLNNILVLVLENIHKIMNQSYKNDFFDFLRSPTQETNFLGNLRIVISMISDIEEVNYLGTASSFTNASEKIHLKTLDSRQISRLLESYEFDNSEETVGKIKELVGGNIYLISVLLDYTAEANRDIRQVLASPDIDRIFDSRLETLHALISEIDGAERILDKFKDEDIKTVQLFNHDRHEKIILDDLAKIGVLIREGKETEILYSIQGNCLKKLINHGLSNF